MKASDEIANQDIENTVKNVKSSEEVKVFKEMEKVIRSDKYNILSLVYHQVQIFERFKLNNEFMNQFGIYDVINTVNEIIVALKIY